MFLLSASLGDALPGIQHKPQRYGYLSLLAGKQREVVFYPLSWAYKSLYLNLR